MMRVRSSCSWAAEDLQVALFVELPHRKCRAFAAMHAGVFHCGTPPDSSTRLDGEGGRRGNRQVGAQFDVRSGSWTPSLDHLWLECISVYSVLRTPCRVGTLGTLASLPAFRRTVDLGLG